MSDPAGCVALSTYECSNTGPVDLCSLGTFDQRTGSYSLDITLTDIAPPDTYVVTIKGTILSNPAEVTFSVTLLCIIEELTLVNVP